MRTLVIDVGTSGLRAAIINDDGSVSDLHYEEFSPSSPANGMVEFDAMAMYAAVKRVATATIGSSRSIIYRRDSNVYICCCGSRSIRYGIGYGRNNAIKISNRCKS